MLQSLLDKFLHGFFQELFQYFFVKFLEELLENVAGRTFETVPTGIFEGIPGDIYD